MPFAPENKVEPYLPAPPPALPGSGKVHYENELRRLQSVIGRLVAAIEEMQTHLASQ